jgi:hypothetical protein
MRTSALGLGVVLGLATLAGCWQKAGPPPAATIAPAPAPTTTEGTARSNTALYPDLHVRSGQELDFGHGTKGRLWTLTGQQFKSLTVTLVVARDGKKEPGNEITCGWDESSKNVDAQLVLLLQDGSAFGAKGKRLPALTLQFRSGAPDSRKTVTAAGVHDTLPPRASSTATDSSVSFKDLLFYELSGDPATGETVTIGGTEDSLIEASKNKRLVVGVLVEWKQ